MLPNLFAPVKLNVYTLKFGKKNNFFIFFFLKCLLRGSLLKTGPLRFGSENQFPLNFAHEYTLVQK